MPLPGSGIKPDVRLTFLPPALEIRVAVAVDALAGGAGSIVGAGSASLAASRPSISTKSFRDISRSASWHARAADRRTFPLS